MIRVVLSNRNMAFLEMALVIVANDQNGLMIFNEC
jgi:hypothetical protein